ncbi:MAG: carboxysome peptide B [Pseudomonadota bacterium]
MDILRVKDELVCTRRVPGLAEASLRVLQGQDGAISVATDPVGAPPGRWVFATTGTAARLAMGDASLVTDLSICGIIDGWDVPAAGSAADDTARSKGAGA